MSKSVIILLGLVASSLHAGTITWTHQTHPINCTTYPTTEGFSSLQADPVNGKIIAPGVAHSAGGACSSSIYYSLLSWYDPTNNSFVDGVSDGTDYSFIGCSPDTATQLGNRHPYAQNTIDTVRNWYWQMGGANQGCHSYTATTSGTAVTLTGNQVYSGFVGQQVNISGVNYTVASVTDALHFTLTTSAGTQSGALMIIPSRSTGSNETNDLYHMALNSNPTSNSWVQMSPAHFPNRGVESSLTHDSLNDVLVFIGANYDNIWVYCYIASGGLSSAQTNAGCSSPNDFISISPVNGQVDISGANLHIVAGDTTAVIKTGDAIVTRGASYTVSSITDATHFVVSSSIGTYSAQNWHVVPIGTDAVRPVYDPTTAKIWIYGGRQENGTGPYNDLWAYIVSDATNHVGRWQHMAINSPITPPLENNATYPQAAFTLNPSDHKFYYHQSTGTGHPADYRYDPNTDAWTQLTNVGNGDASAYGSLMAYSTVCSCFVTYSGSTGTPPDIWTGVVSDSPTVITTLNINEQLYPGDATGTSYSGSFPYSDVPGGVARTNEPFCQGVPLADSLGVTDPQTLGLTAAAAGQFRTLGKWPSGNLKWVEVCGILPSLSAGATSTSVALQKGASGNFGGSNLASLASGTITVSTGSATFTVKAGAYFNVIDTAVVGGTTVVSSSGAASRGLTILGPSTPGTFPNNVTCGSGTGQSPCTLLYSSANDPNSTCTIEENGPVMAALKCLGTFYDNASHPYMHYTARLYFYQGKNYVKVAYTRRNADYLDSADSAGTTFNVSAKGMAENALNLDLGISGTLNYTISVDPASCTSGLCTGTLNGTSDTAYIYQAMPSTTTTQMFQGSDCNLLYCFNTFTNDVGYTAQKNSTVIASSATASITAATNANPAVFTTAAAPQTGDLITIRGATGSWTGANGIWLVIQQSPTTFTVCVGTPSCSGTYLDSTSFGALSGSLVLQTGKVYTKTFFADIADSGGAGVMIGIDHGAENFPHSLEFLSGGTVARIGIAPSENGNPFGSPGNGTFRMYQGWPFWSIRSDLVLEFHATNPSNLTNDFLSIQHPLMVSESISYLNSTGVFPYPMPDPTSENTYLTTTFSASSCQAGAACTAAFGNANPGPGWAAYCCTLDLGTANPSLWGMQNYRTRVWHDGGPANQEEYRWADLLRSLRLSTATPQWGRFLNSRFFYNMESANSWPHSDGILANGTDSTPNNFAWRNQSHLDNYGQPTRSCQGGYDASSPCSTITNSGKAYSDYLDINHRHWWGILDYYMLTGDENMRDAVTSEKDWYLNTSTLQSYGVAPGLDNLRQIGNELIASGRLSEWLYSIGDTDAAGVKSHGESVYTNQVLPDSCFSGYPSGCTMPNSTVQAGPDPQGVSRVRGVITGPNGRGSGPICNTITGNFRGIAGWYASLAVEGLLALRRVEGSAWAENYRALDLAYGIAQYTLQEEFHDDGGSYFFAGGGQAGTYGGDSLYNGLGYSTTADFALPCPNGTAVVSGVTAQFNSVVYNDLQIMSTARQAQSMFMLWYVLSQVQGALTASDIRKFNAALTFMRSAPGGPAVSEFSSYQLPSIIQSINSPPAGALTLQDIPITSVTHLSGNNWQLSWTTPSGSSSPRLKYDSTRTVCSSINCPGSVSGMLNYDEINTGTFQFSPASYITWFGATDATSSLPTWTPGAQTATVNAGVSSGLTAANFSLRALALSGCTLSPTSIGSYTAGQVIGQTFTPSGCATSTCSISAGSLTGSGLSLGGSQNCVLSGTAVAGTYNFTISYDTASNPITLSVNAAPSITTSSPLPGGVVGVPYSQTLAASGGTAPLTWTVTSGSTPAGMNLSSGGVLSGTPTTAALYSFVATVTDANSVSANKTFSITISAALSNTPSTSSSGVTGAGVSRREP